MQVFSCLLSWLLPGGINPKNDFYNETNSVWTKVIYLYKDKALLLNGSLFLERNIPVHFVLSVFFVCLHSERDC